MSALMMTMTASTILVNVTAPLIINKRIKLVILTMMMMMMMIALVIEMSYEHPTWPLTTATHTFTHMQSVDLLLTIVVKVPLWQLGMATLRIRRVFVFLMFVCRATVPCEVTPHPESNFSHPIRLVHDDWFHASQLDQHRCNATC